MTPIAQVNTPALLDLVCEQGTTFRFACLYQDADGEGVYLSDWDATLNMFTDYGATPVLALTTGDGSIVLDVDGNITAAADAASMNMVAVRYRWELTLTSGPIVDPLIKGFAQVTP